MGGDGAAAAAAADDDDDDDDDDDAPGGQVPLSSALDEPGVTFITHFCDNQDTDISLSVSVMDLIARVAEKQVPASMMELYGIARRLPPPLPRAAAAAVAGERESP